MTEKRCEICGGTGVVCHVLAEGGEAGVGSWRIWQTADALCECKRSELDYRNDRDSGVEGGREAESEPWRVEQREVVVKSWQSVKP